MQLILARRRGHAETWAKANGHQLARTWGRVRSDSTVYVDNSTQLHGRALTAADTVIVLDGFEQRANAELITLSVAAAGSADPDGGPQWETR